MRKLVVFDMDGTLLDTLGDLHYSGNKALKQLGFPEHSREAYCAFIGKGLRNQMAQSLPQEHRDDKTIDQLTKCYRPIYAANMSQYTVIYDGVLPLLHRLKESGWQLGILSNKPDSYVVELTEAFFPGLFSAARGFREGVPLKPNPAALHEIISELGHTPESCVYIGDSEVDVLTGRNAGVKTGAVSWGYCTKEKLIQANPDVVIDNPESLEKFLVDN